MASADPQSPSNIERSAANRSLKRKSPESSPFPAEVGDRLMWLWEAAAQLDPEAESHAKRARISTNRTKRASTSPKCQAVAAQLSHLADAPTALQQPATPPPIDSTAPSSQAAHEWCTHPHCTSIKGPNGTITPMWRSFAGIKYCNSCALRLKRAFERAQD
ncbi:hypothetical protein ACK3TF_000250 [Chlorella vulgaris]